MDAVCLYRAGLGTLICSIALQWLPNATELFSSESFHLGPLADHAPTPAAAFSLCVALAISSLGVALGAFTRLSLLVTLCIWTLLYAIDLINEKANSTITIVTLAVLLFAPCARRYSIDAWMARRRGPGTRKDTASVFPQRLLQLEFAQVYLVSGLVKATSADWWSGFTLEQALGSRWGTGPGVWISGWMPTWLAVLGSTAAMGFEILATPLLFLPQTRRWAILCGVIFHLAIQATLEVGALGFHFVLALLLLFPRPETIARLARRATGGGGSSDGA